MRSNKKYKFKIIDGVLSWKNEEMKICSGFSRSAYTGDFAL